MKLRDYQQDAHDAAIAYIRKSLAPGLIQAPTAAGKSFIVAALAHTMHQLTGKSVLCIVPKKELLLQNAEKYRLTGNECSLFSASVGRKSLRHPVVIGTPKSIKNQLDRFDDRFCLIIIDECHEITPSIISIIEAIRAKNDKVRVLGLSATPYRLKTGYIYAIDERNKVMESAKNPFFAKRVFTITARELIDKGFMSPPVIGETSGEHYDTLGLQVNSTGRFDDADIDKAFHGHGRLTSIIVADVVERARNRQGVILFCATVQHAHEVLASLPPGLSAVVTGETKTPERDRAVADFKVQKIKYMVNVGVFTTGFDAPHVDVVALLRATESVSLMQQIIGRGARISPETGKKDFIILDYAENIDRHCPDGDIFNPKITTVKDPGEEKIDAECPKCGSVCEYAAAKNEAKLGIDAQGYFVTLTGQRMRGKDGKEIPAHMGRKCKGLVLGRDGLYYDCDFRWVFKKCEACGAENDISARYCSECEAELIDPNQKLIIDATVKFDPYQKQTEPVLSLDARQVRTKSGKDCVRLRFVTPRRQFDIWLATLWAAKKYDKAIQSGGINTITYRKNAETNFYEVLDYNK